MANDKHLEILRGGAKAWNTWRLEYPSIPPDFHEANLAGFDLAEANLAGANSFGEIDKRWVYHGYKPWLGRIRRHSLDFPYAADLSDADLTDVNLTNANLTNADLTNAKLTNAALTHANLRKTSLYRADLCKADLYGANLDETYLAGANLTDVGLLKTVFGNVDLSCCKNLEKCWHKGPCIIDFQTLQRSGPLPRVFLRGVGLPERVIDDLPSLLNPSKEFYSCFISYSHEDKSFARRLHGQLQDRGIRCWLDEHQMLPGDDISEQVDHGIRLWDKVLLCASRHSLTSWWVDGEINRAFQKEVRLMKERGSKVLALVPLNLDDYLFEWPNGKATEVRSRLAADFTGWAKDDIKFEEQFKRLVRALQTGESGREKPPISRL